MARPIPSHRHFGYMLHKLTGLVDRLADHALSNELQIGLSQFLILLPLSQQKTWTQTDVARFLELTDAAVSRQVDLLVEKRYLSRTENPANRRQHLLTLTKAGTRTVRRAFAILEAEFGGLLGRLDLREQRQFLGLLEKLLRQFDCDPQTAHCLRSDHKSDNRAAVHRKEKTYAEDAGH